ncbi:MAG: cytochrome C biogenesis protein [Methanobrevibacter sp.]|nr:cytochrome C biogenesis protein [Methanobrevibacter sp.]
MDFIPIISFLLGILSIISPCIIPVLPILFGFSIKNSNNKELLSFILGLFSIFTILIFVTAFFTVIFYNYVFYIRIIAAIIILIIGILFISNKTFSLSFKGNSNKNSFMLGVLTSLAWSPCYGGYLISLISILLSYGNVIYNALNIVIYCVGFGVALFVLSFVISKLNIEKLVKNADYLRKISGVLFIFAAIYMILTALGF